MVRDFRRKKKDSANSAKFWWNPDEISLKFSKIWTKLSKILQNFCKILASFLLKFWVQSGAKGWKSCRSRKIWKNAPTLAIVAVDATENERFLIFRFSTWFSYPIPTDLHRAVSICSPWLQFCIAARVSISIQPGAGRWGLDMKTRLKTWKLETARSRLHRQLR